MHLIRSIETEAVVRSLAPGFAAAQDDLANCLGEAQRRLIREDA
jgi:hypothetical protein